MTLLDGDVICQHLSSELSLSSAHPNLSINHIDFVTSEITEFSFNYEIHNTQCSLWETNESTTKKRRIFTCTCCGGGT